MARSALTKVSRPPARPATARRADHPPSLPRASRRAAAADADARLGQRPRGLTPPPSPPCTQRRMDRAAASSAQGPPSAAASSTARSWGSSSTRLAGKDLSAGPSAAAASLPVGDADSGRPRPGTPQGSSVHLPPAGGRTPPSSSDPRPPSPSGTGFCRMASGASAHRPHNVAPRRTAGDPHLRAPFPRRLRSRPRPDDLAVRPARRIQQAPARTVGCEVDNRLVDQTFSRHLAPHVVIDPGPHERRPASGTSGPAGLL